MIGLLRRFKTQSPPESSDPGPGLTTDDSLEFSHPQWSPADQDKILVVIDHLNLATISVATGAVDYLTDFDESTIVVDYPSWSLDGSLIHFSISRRRGDIYLVTRAGGD